MSMGHRISAINDSASVHNLPNARSSADSSFSLGKNGKGSPRTSRDTQDSVEDSVETAQQLCSVTNKNVGNNRATPPGKSSVKNSTQDLKPVIEFEDVSDQIELNDENIQELFH